MRSKSKIFAFSLVELSLVILVVGILLLAVTNGASLIGKSKIASAIALTNSSPVSGINGLAIWMESVDVNNIAVGSSGSGIFGDPEDEDGVSGWRDRNPQSSEKILFSALSDDTRPIYTREGINGIPTIRFDGSNDTLASSRQINSLKFTNGKEITIFLVAKESDRPSFFELYFSHQPSSNGKITIEADYNEKVKMCFTISNCFPSVATITDQNIVSTFIKSQNNLDIYINGGASADASKANSNEEITPGDANAYIGSNSSDLFVDADIGEIIIFNRALRDIERRAVEEYLGKKWGIEVDNS